MAGGGGALPEPGFLDVPTFTLAAVLACFLLASLAFERVSGVNGRRYLTTPPAASGVLTRCTPAAIPRPQSTHWLIRFLKKRKRNGLAQAVSNLITELVGRWHGPPRCMLLAQMQSWRLTPPWLPPCSPRRSWASSPCCSRCCKAPSLTFVCPTNRARTICGP